MQVKVFTFNPFQENTYVLYDHSKECMIIDPGCFVASEDKVLFDFISSNQLKPVAIVNTHCHIDHVFGVNSVKQKYQIPFYCHKGEVDGLRRIPDYAPMYGMQVQAIDEPNDFIDETSVIQFGNTKLESRFTPGHSPASLCFIHNESKQIIAGDVLFEGSIGRTDLPGGDYDTLMQSIFSELLPLADEYEVYPGHGDATTIGRERKTNPFILEYQRSMQ